MAGHVARQGMSGKRKIPGKFARFLSEFLTTAEFRFAGDLQEMADFSHFVVLARTMLIHVHTPSSLE